MCVYCFIADWMNEHSPWKPVTIPSQPWPAPLPWQPGPVPPFGPTPLPTPAPIYPIDNPEGTRWTQKQLDDALEILRRVKEMEDALGGCPCEEPSKMDFLKEIQERLDRMEQILKAKENGGSEASEDHSVTD